MPAAIFRIHLDVFDSPQDADLAHRCVQRILDAVSANAADYLRVHPETPSMYDSELRYIRSDLNSRYIDCYDIPSMRKRRGGVCPTFATARAGELQVRGDATKGTGPMNARPMFYWLTLPEGRLSFHIQVARPDGVEDPSKFLGM